MKINNSNSHDFFHFYEIFRFLLLIILCLFFSKSPTLSAQIKQLTFDIGTFANSRILLLDKNIFTDRDKNIVKDLEVPTPSFDLSIGFNYSKNEKSQIGIGLAHRWMQFGSKKYIIPDSITNITGYPKVRQSVYQNQILAYINYTYKTNLLSNRLSFFVGTDIIFNYKDYVIRFVNYDLDDNRGISGKGGGANTHFHSFDLRLNIGVHLLVWHKNKQTLSLQPFLGSYIRPYNAYGEGQINGYLPLKRNTKGIVWDCGLRVIYAFQKK